MVQVNNSLQVAYAASIRSTLPEALSDEIMNCSFFLEMSVNIKDNFSFQFDLKSLWY